MSSEHSSSETNLTKSRANTNTSVNTNSHANTNTSATTNTSLNQSVVTSIGKNITVIKCITPPRSQIDQSNPQGDTSSGDELSFQPKTTA